tara:strand:+ start:9486 stop:9722 length:237 start_codon:yes stop_codon:yes gene_type:complete
MTTNKTATETEALMNERYVRIRHVTVRFLNNTKALHLERDLTEFLIDIDRRHQEEVEELKRLIAFMSAERAAYEKDRP